LKVLILKPSSLGDVVQALPVLRLIKLYHPNSEIYWWIDAALAPLLEGDPDLAGLIPFDRRRWSVPWRWDELWQSIRQLRAHRFDWVIDLQSLFRSGAMAWFANGAVTIGLDDHRDGARGFYDVFVPRRSYYTHAVDWYLDVLPSLGVPLHKNFIWLPERPHVIDALKVRWRPEPAKWIALQPSARWTNKRWPIEHFAEVVQKLAVERPDVRFAILGGEADHEFGEALVHAAPGRCLDLTGRTSLQEMVEWVRFCELIVTNDTGPMHVAAALGKPVVALFGPTDPRRTGPYGQVDQVFQNRLPCVPCMKASCSYAKPLECLRAIPPKLVVDRVEQLLNRPAPCLSLNRNPSARVD
jgi:heptosyltransferase I